MKSSLFNESNDFAWLYTDFVPFSFPSVIFAKIKTAHVTYDMMILKADFCNVCCWQTTSKSSILKPAGTRLSSASKSAAGTTTNSQRTDAKPDGKTTNRAPSSRTAGKDRSKQKSTNDWDDSSWGDQWWRYVLQFVSSLTTFFLLFTEATLQSSSYSMTSFFLVFPTEALIFIKPPEVYRQACVDPQAELWGPSSAGVASWRLPSRRNLS